jgi:hypothetical protein
MAMRRNALIVMAAMTALFALAALPGTATLAARAGAGGGTARLTSVSCASAGNLGLTKPGNCAAGGFYVDGLSRDHAFVLIETAGRWGRAICSRGCHQRWVPVPGGARCAGLGQGQFGG